MRNLLPFTVNAIPEKSGFPTMAAMIGVIRSLTSAVTTPRKRRAHDEGYGKIENVTTQQKLLESLHRSPSSRYMSKKPPAYAPLILGHRPER